MPRSPQHEQAPKSTTIQVNFPTLTVPQMINLLRLVCSKQHLIQKMLCADLPRIDRDYVEELSHKTTVSPEVFMDEMQRGIEEGRIQGFSISERSVRLTVPFAEENSPRWMAYSLLLLRMTEHARKAHRVQLAIDDPENEKYAARSLLLRLGFNGADNREARSILLDHLHGYAAFRDENGMQVHRARQAAKRVAEKEADKNHD